MRQRFILELKPILSTNEDNLRIYEMLKKSCEGLNSYLADFHQTVEILNERRGLSGDDIATEENIQSVLGKIDEVTSSMKEIANHMPSLITLIELQN